MTTITSNWQAVHAAIAAAARAAGRDPATVDLLAVSKTFPASAVREAYAVGQRAFGENYVQEAVEKMAELADLPIEWHFIGPIQSNKTRSIAEHFAWVHGVDRPKIAARLSEQRPAGLPPLNICLQVNISGEDSKSGVRPGEVEALAQAIAGLPNLRLRGLMAIPAPASGETERAPFARMRELQQQLNAHGFRLDTLSMGMSHDFAAAIHEGATLVRVGTAIFGPRNYGETT
ncbi:YggS family pyridoxal phosphate-dependent enzyme [Ferriphaselus sp. R-1]|uniref:YggS family pyridoxal phosphate-dependent enzyme n=1 Tax=Ferriphaselus sp. R-1 TaxID=1485544 RepID=UPI00054F3C2D|nr:YggS family pyridoxal phosphate-dependent enzyme [Ferriphaselus sp. R-1]